MEVDDERSSALRLMIGWGSGQRAYTSALKCLGGFDRYHSTRTTRPIHSTAFLWHNASLQKRSTNTGSQPLLGRGDFRWQTRHA